MINISFLNKKKLFFLGIAIAIVVMFFDLLSKRVIFAILDKIALDQNIENPEIKICDFSSLIRVWNHGVSFGMFSGVENSQIIFCLVQSLILVILVIWLYRNQKPHFSYALGLIIGGALGNVIDRFQNAAVADFLDLHIAQYHWPAFNLADSSVFIGVAILVFDDLIFSKSPNKSKK